jgi:hypothetical protein
VLIISCALWAQSGAGVVWKHLSTKSGDLPAPNTGTEQTSATVFDIDKDDSKIYLFLGDGKGNFTSTVVASGYDSHESKVADLGGNGSLDLLVKPYNWETPRLDIFLNVSPTK